LGESDAAVHSNPTLHRMRPDQPAFQETRIRLPRQDATMMSGPEGPDNCPVTRHEGAQPGRPSAPGHQPRPRAGSQNRNSATTGLGAGSPNVTHQNVTRKCAGRGQAHVEDTSQVNYSRNSVPTNRLCRTRTSNLMEHSAESTDGKYFQISTRFAPCNKFGIDPLRTRTCYQREHNQVLQADAIFSQT
jgi:hypothetical protein